MAVMKQCIEVVSDLLSSSDFQTSSLSHQVVDYYVRELFKLLRGFFVLDCSFGG